MAQAVTAIADTVSALPPKIVEIAPNGQQRVVNHPVSKYLKRPCSWLGWSSWVSTLMHDVLLRGNAYAVIEGDQLIPVSQVTVLQGRTELVYDVTFNFPYQKTKSRISSDNILHFRNSYLDGFKTQALPNLSLVPSLKLMAQSLSGALVQSLKQGIYPSAVAQFNSDDLEPEDAERIQAELEAKFRAETAYQRPIVVGKDIDIKAVNPTSAKDAMLNEARSAMIRDVSNAFNIPQTNLNLLEHSTLANVQEYNKQFYQNCLRPHIVRFQEVFSNALLEDKYQLILDTQSLTHGDILDRRKSVIEMFKAGILGDVATQEAQQTARELLDLG